MSVEYMWNYAKRGQSKYSEINLLQNPFFPHKFQPDCSGIELAPPRQQAGE